MNPLSRDVIKQGIVTFMAFVVTEASWDNSKYTIEKVELLLSRIKYLKHAVFVIDNQEIKEVANDSSNIQPVDIGRVFVNWINELNARQSYDRISREFGDYLIEHKIRHIVLEHAPGALFLVDEIDQLDPIVVKLATSLTMKIIPNMDLEEIIREVFDEHKLD
jgi:hypothetical protein